MQQPSARGRFVAAMLGVAASATLAGCAAVMWAIEDRGEPAPAAAVPGDTSSPLSGEPSRPVAGSGASTSMPAAPAAPANLSAPTQAPPAARREGSAAAFVSPGSPGRATAAAAPVPAAPGAALRVPPPASAGAEASGRYAVQVGAYRVEASAHKVRDRIAGRLRSDVAFGEEGWKVRVVAAGELFRVFVGETDSLEVAKALALRIRHAIQPDAFVTRP
ncbi:MAG: SPOR domain-containing protein [Rubrivivax sp.]|nr:SPOR domain-containing protein [Rubrivivax sp.]